MIQSYYVYQGNAIVWKILNKFFETKLHNKNMHVSLRKDFVKMSWKINWDALGIGASVACAIHCALLPLVLSTLPVFGIDILENKKFEYFMILLAFGIGAYALSHGFRKHHKSIIPLIIFSCGMVFLFAKEIWHDHAVLLLIPAVTLIVSSHYINFKLCRKTASTHDEHCAH